MHIDIHKFHLEATIKFATLLFTVTTAALGYYVQIDKGIELRKFFLFPTLVMNLVFARGFFVAGQSVKPRHEEVLAIAKRLSFQSAPNLGLLGRFLRFMCFVTCIVALTLGYLIVFKS